MSSSQSKKIKTHQQGFTLVELMVSLSIFAIVMTISVSTLLVLIDANAKAQALSSANTNLSFALDSVTREIRTGFHYFCKNGSTNPASEGFTIDIVRDATRDCEKENAISFAREWDSTQIMYRFVLYDERGAIQYREMAMSGGPDDDTGWQDITSKDVDIESLEITVRGSNPSDAVQPTVDLSIKGYVVNGLDTETRFNIQTHVVQRLLDRV